MNKKFLRAIIFIVIIIFTVCIGKTYADVNSLEKGIENYRSENYEEALSLFIEARKEQPASSIAAFYLGVTYKQLKEYQLAEKNLRDSLQLSPPVKDAYLELAEVLYTQDQLNEAEGWALKAETEGINPANAVFLRGMILSKRGITEDAIAAFNKAKKMNPALAQPADFQIALIQLKTRNFTDARKTFKAIEEIDPTSELASFAKEYEKSLSRTLDIYKTWRFTIGTAYQYDDNVILKPTTSIPGVEITGERDSSILATLGIIFSPILREPFFINCQYNLYTNTYFDTNTHNLMTHTISVNPGINIKNGSIFLPVSYSHIWVHEREYMSLISVKPGVQFAFLPQHIARFSIGYDKRELLKAPIDSDEDRDANIFNASTGYIHPFSGGKGLFNLIYEFSYDNSDGKNWDNIGNRITAGLLLPSLILKTDFILSGEVFLQNYKNNHTVFDKKRKDKNYTLSINLVRELVRGLFLNLQYSYTRADSNIAIYDYDRNIYTAGVEYRF